MLCSCFRNTFRPATVVKGSATADCFFKIDHPHATAVAEVRFDSINGMALVEKLDPNFVIPIEREPAGQLYRSAH